MKGGKIAVIVVSIVLLVGVFIGLIASVARSGNSSDTSNLSTSAKAIATICAPTDYKEACMNSLGSVANNNASLTPKDLVQMAINVTIEEVKSALLKSQDIGKAANDSSQKMAFDDCKDLLDFAVDELQASFSMVGDADMHSMSDREADLKNWLSAVISYQQTCLDGINPPELKSAMSNGLLNASQFTDNALTIISEISGLLNAFNINTSAATSRRLLDTPETDTGSYPPWFSAGDRKLLATQGSGQLKPNAVVAKDGTGQYKTIGAALAAYPKNQQE